MTVSLRQAWDICAVLDELEEDRTRQDSERAAYLISPRVEPRPPKPLPKVATRVRRPEPKPMPVAVDRDLEERLRLNKRKRLAAMQRRRA